MKRNVFFPIAVTLAAMTCCLQSCDFFKHGGSGTDADSVTFCTVMYEDSATIVEASIFQKMEADFPVPEATGALADSIRAYLAEAIVNHRFPIFEEEDSTTQAFEYQIGKEQEFLNAYAGEGMTRMVNEVTQMAEDGWAMGYYNEYTASVELQTNKYVTYVENYDIYTGGAHGSHIVTGLTFRKSDGCLMGWKILDLNKKAEIIALIKEELRDYFAFSEEDGPLTDEQLYEQLQLWDNPDTPENELEYGVPLPYTPPYVSREGLAFVYQQYEIACYAAGLPSFIISFDKIRDFLSPEGRELLEME